MGFNEAIRRARELPGLTPRQQRLLSMLVHVKGVLAEKLDVPTQTLIDWLQAPDFASALGTELEEVLQTLDVLAIGALVDLVTQGENKRVRMRAIEYIGELNNRIGKDGSPTSNPAINIANFMGSPPAQSSSPPVDTVVDLRHVALPGRSNGKNGHG